MRCLFCISHWPNSINVLVLFRTLSGAISSTSAVILQNFNPTFLKLIKSSNGPLLAIPSPLLSICWSDLFVMCSAPLALVGPSTMAFWLVECVELSVAPVGVRDHYDWLFSLVNHVMNGTYEAKLAIMESSSNLWWFSLNLSVINDVVCKNGKAALPV